MHSPISWLVRSSLLTPSEQAIARDFFVPSAFISNSFSPSRRDERLEFFHQFREAFERDLLRAIAPSLGGIGVNLDEKSIGAHGDGAIAHRGDEIGPPRSLAGIDHDRAM
jgi:hypothetical protein